MKCGHYLFPRPPLIPHLSKTRMYISFSFTHSFIHPLTHLFNHEALTWLPAHGAFFQHIHAVLCP